MKAPLITAKTAYGYIIVCFILTGLLGFLVDRATTLQAAQGSCTLVIWITFCFHFLVGFGGIYRREKRENGSP